MNKVIKLVAKDGSLFFPAGGYNDCLEACPDRPKLLLKIYAAGDCDRIPWPLVPGEYSSASVADLKARLAEALYDERESNEYFPIDAKIALPDGEMFDFDAVLAGIY